MNTTSTLPTEQLIADLCNADLRTKAAQRGITPPTTVEAVIIAYVNTLYLSAVTKCVDPGDIYEWKALAESELATIRLIEACRKVVTP